jgi:hypothetical protein
MSKVVRFRLGRPIPHFRHMKPRLQVRKSDMDTNLFKSEAAREKEAAAAAALVKDKKKIRGKNLKVSIQLNLQLPPRAE